MVTLELPRCYRDLYGVDPLLFAQIAAHRASPSACLDCGAPLVPWLDQCEACALEADGVIDTDADQPCDHVHEPAYRWTDRHGRQWTACDTCGTVVGAAPAKPKRGTKQMRLRLRRARG